MQAVLDQIASLGGKPIAQLTPQEARQQPTPADAVKSLLQKRGQSNAPEAVAKVENKSIRGPDGEISLRIYTPWLGWKEFAPDYIGPFHPETHVCETENHHLPTTLRMVFDQMQCGKVRPSFYNRNNHPDLRIEKGVLTYA